jgi:hypothetical protein
MLAEQWVQSRVEMKADSSDKKWAAWLACSSGRIRALKMAAKMEKLLVEKWVSMKVQE